MTRGEEYKISVLLPSKYPEKREKFLQNLREMSYDYNSLEICICLDGTNENWQNGNHKYTYLSPSPYGTRFFNAAYRISTAPWIFLANDDMEIKTKDWDYYLPLNNPYALYYFKDNDFNDKFSCHPLTSRAVWELCDEKGLIFPDYKNMGCDTTIWDVIPSQNKVYIPKIEIQHDRDMDPIKESNMVEDYGRYNLTAPRLISVRKEIFKRCGLDETKILIGLSTMEHIRKADFLPYFLGLEKPPGTLITTVHGQSPAQARNIVIDQALENKCTHIFFMDDDMAVPPDTINRLLRHDKDIVTALYLMRDYPHRPLIFNEAFPNGSNRFMFLTPEVEGLIEVTNCGLGACLVNTRIFAEMEKPYVRLGEIEKDGWCDDIGFFNRVRAAGFKIFCDTDTVAGHMVSNVIWPERQEDKSWHSVYKNDKGKIQFPQLVPLVEEVGT